MKSTIRCCISCIIPCGALDVIRIVHANGHVEEITGGGPAKICAADVMKLHPKHVLKMPAVYSSDDHGIPIPKIVEVPPDMELRRGKIYFLIPVAASSKNNTRSTTRKAAAGKSKKKKLRNNNFLISADHYLKEITSDKLPNYQRDRSRGRVAVWRPHLESISETLHD